MIYKKKLITADGFGFYSKSHITLDLIDNRPTGHIWASSSKVVDTISYQITSMIRSLHIPDVKTWIGSNLQSTATTPAKHLVKDYIQALQPIFEKREMTWRNQSYPHGSMRDLWCHPDPTSRPDYLYNGSWSYLFSLRNWLRMKMGCHRPSKHGLCRLCGVHSNQDWCHVLNECKRTEDIRHRLNLNEELVLRDVTSPFDHDKMKLERIVRLASYVMYLLDQANDMPSSTSD